MAAPIQVFLIGVCPTSSEVSETEHVGLSTFNLQLTKQTPTKPDQRNTSVT